MNVAKCEHAGKSYQAQFFEISSITLHAAFHPFDQEATAPAHTDFCLW